EPDVRLHDWAIKRRDQRVGKRNSGAAGTIQRKASKRKGRFLAQRRNAAQTCRDSFPALALPRSGSKGRRTSRSALSAGPTPAPLSMHLIEWFRHHLNRIIEPVSSSGTSHAGR